MSKIRIRARWLAPVAALALAVAGCGSDGGEPTTRPLPPTDPDAPVTGTLRTFTYSDTASDAILAPFRKQNPDLDLKTATFDSVQEGSAKIAGGFETDVVQACADEYQPLLARDLLRPIDPDGIDDWDELEFRDNEGVQPRRRARQLRPDRGRAAGDHLQHRRGRPTRRLHGPTSSTPSTPAGSRSTAAPG